MYKKIYLLFTVVTQFCFGQQLLPIQYDTTFYSKELIFSGMGEYSSSSMQNDLTRKLLFGGIITDEIKDASFSKHKQINRFGVDLNSELEYRNMKVNLFKNEKIGYIIKGGFYSFGSAVYSKDAFGLIFNGNSDYLDQSADFSGSGASYISFQKIGFGIIDKKTKSNFSFNFYNVSDYYRGYIKDGILTQNDDGTSIMVKLDGEISATQGNTFSKGYGIGIDFDYRIPMAWGKDQNAAIQVLVKNIGIVNYHRGIQTYSIDSTYSYNGFKLNQLYGDTNMFSTDYSIMDTLQIQKTVQKRNIFLPGFLQIGKIVDDHDEGKWQSFFGIRLYPSLAFSPLIYVGAHFKVAKWLEIGTQGSYGGFSNFRFGLYSNIRYKKWSFGIASQDIYGAISQKGYGQSLLIRLRCKI